MSLTTPVRRFLGWATSPLLLYVLRHIPIDDPWEPLTSRLVTHQRFGRGSYRMFRWYLQGDSLVPVSTIDDVCSWLAGCEYVSDPHLFNQPDFWQHPRTFENIRKGDCEDHALWAWRKLIELQYRAELFVGRLLAPCDDEHNAHAWVVFERDGQRFILEAADKNGDPMVRPLAEARADYIPYFSVDADLVMRSHAGYLIYLKEYEAICRSKGSRQRTRV